MSHDQDAETLRALGYRQELVRRMSGFSNYAISLSIICVLAGGITSFHLGFCSAGGAAIGIGWPLAVLMSLAFAATMAQIASAFPTAGGLYHWAAILGGRGWGWLTAWLNLLGLVTVLAAINVGAYQFVMGSLAPLLGFDASAMSETAKTAMQITIVALITGSQALINHFGIKVTTRLTDFSGWLILVVAAILTLALLVFSPGFEWARLATFTNYSGLPAASPVWPRTESMAWVFLLGIMLPAYTITGFDASAHTSEETIKASHNVPRGIIRSVLVSGIVGWAMLAALVMAMPDMGAAAAQGDNVVFWTIDHVMPRWLGASLYFGIAAAQYLCGLATVTSASRVAYAFARDGGLPWSSHLRRVNERRGVPVVAIWTVSALAVAFTLYTPVYSTITTVCVIFLYLSYLLPTALGLKAHGKTWTRFGPWTLGRHFKWLSCVCILGAVLLLVVGIQPPNDKALWILVGSCAFAALIWYGWERRRFPGPPVLQEQHR